MRAVQPLVAATLVASCSVARPAAAAEYHRGAHVSTAAGTAQTVASTHLLAGADVLRLRGVDLELTRVIASKGYSTVRRRQRYHGLPVAGASVAVRVGPGGNVLLTMVDVARRLDVDPAPGVSRERGQAIAEGWARSSFPEGTRATLVVLPNGESGTLTWTFDVPDLRGGSRYRVNAHDGGLLEARSLAHEALGRVYPTNPLATPDTEDRELEGLDVVSPRRLEGWESDLLVTRFVHGETEPDWLDHTLGPSSGEDFLYDPPGEVTDPADPFAEVNAYYHLARARELFSGYGVDMSGPEWRLVVAVNVLDTGEPFDGAFFSPAGLGPPWNAPSFLAFGQGHAADFAYDADAFVHEFTHYVNYNAIDFNAGQFAFDDRGLSPFSYAIDEGVADYFACSSAGDPVVGEASLATIGKTRDIASEVLRCPDDIGGEGHLDGILISNLGWSLRERFGVEIADSLMWTATTLLPHRATFGDFARGVVQRGTELMDEGRIDSPGMEAIHEFLRERGLDDCDRSIEVPVGASRTALVFGFDSLAQVLDSTCGELLSAGESLPGLFQFHARASGADGIRFDVQLEPVSDGGLDWAIYVRRNEPVGFEVGQTVPVPVARSFDYAATGIHDASASLVVDAASDPPFDPNATYHLVLTHRNCPGVRARIAARAVTRGEASEAGSQPGGGCGCTTTARGDWPVLLLLCLVLGVGRRRSTRPRRA